MSPAVRGAQAVVTVAALDVVVEVSGPRAIVHDALAMLPVRCTEAAADLLVTAHDPPEGPHPVGSPAHAHDVGRLADAVEQAVAEHTRLGVTVHAGAVGWRSPHGEAALLVCGRSHAGKSTLVSALVRHGAVYLGNEFAVVDRDAHLHPLPGPLVERVGGERHHTLPRFDPCATSHRWPVAVIAAATYRPWATWCPEELCGAAAALPVIENVLQAADATEDTMAVTAAVAEHAQVLVGERGEADLTAPLLIEALERRLGTGG